MIRSKAVSAVGSYLMGYEDHLRLGRRQGLTTFLRPVLSVRDVGGFHITYVNVSVLLRYRHRFWCVAAM